MSTELSCIFTGGREESPKASIVESNYYEADPGEVLLKIDGPVSPATLKEIAQWFTDNTYFNVNNGKWYRQNPRLLLENGS